MASTFMRRTIVLTLQILSLYVLLSIQDTTTEATKPPTVTYDQYLDAGDKALKEGQVDQAIKQFSDAVSDYPDAYMGYFKRATAYQVKAKNRPALADLNKVLDIKPDFLQAKIRRSKLLLSFGRYSAAREDFNEILKEKPDFDTTGTQLPLFEKGEQLLPKATAAMEAKQYEEAKALYSELIDISSDFISARLNRAQCSFELKEYNAVVEDTGRVLKNEKENMDALYLRGRAFYFLGQFDAAQNHFREALKSDPDNSKCKSEYKKIKKVEKALANGDQLYGQNKFTEALEEYVSAQETDTENHYFTPKFYLLQCKCLVKLNKALEAIDKCQKALEADESLVEAVIFIGEAYIVLEDYDKAIHNFQQAKEKDQNSREAQEGINRAQKLQKMAARKDWYKILGVSKQATSTEIRKAFRKLALEWHPDKHDKDKDIAEKKFIEINEANEILSDEEKRRKYDAGEDVEMPAGFNPFQHFQQGGFPGFGGGQQHFTFNFGGR